ncbi:MAG: DUF3465 domain-containing protein [Candidatus Eremiobacteraeota bacterium]|nr:DUF3465 domain-containing protein [Candidatus Eremiobacteraeota bacterium]
MLSLQSAFASHHRSEVAFGATVLDRPRFFYGTNTHAMHEAFEVRADDGHRVEIVDNLALAPRVPVSPGDHIVVQGELIPEARRGALVHWTHHDPAHRHPDGFIVLRGRVYA